MDLMTLGADLATMLTGVSAVSAAGVWIRKQWTGRKEQKAATRRRNWHGYIEVAAISSWHVRLLEQPDSPTSRVVLEVLKPDGRPDPNMAQSLRQHISGDGMLARVPSPEESDFLIALRNERGYGESFPVL